jgi:glycosyltransferase involved in cell wall biosynthesis
MPKYSVIIATHGRPQLLARAIRSVKGQAFPDVTVVVVSDDRSVETYNITNHCLSNDDIYIERGGAPGPAHSRNVGLSVVDSDYVLFLDDDDEFSSNYLHIIDSYIDKNPNSVHFCGYYIVNDEENRSSISNAPVIPVTIGERDLQQLYVQNYIPNSALIYPLDAIKGKCFDDSLDLNEDWDFLLNAIQGRSLNHIPIFGPIIHKTERSKKDRRGALNDHLLPDNILKIYKKWSAPTDALRTVRQSFFASAGIVLPITDF